MLIVVIYIIPEGRAAGSFQFLNLYHYMGITESGSWTGYPHSGNRNGPHRGGAEVQTAKPQPGERKRRTERRK